jgi:hypothetical protein
MNNVNTATAGLDMTAEDLVCMGLEVEEDMARDDGKAGREAAIHNLRSTIEEVGLAALLEIIAEAVGGAADMHADDADLAVPVMVAKSLRKRMTTMVDLLKAVA